MMEQRLEQRIDKLTQRSSGIAVLLEKARNTRLLFGLAAFGCLVGAAIKPELAILQILGFLVLPTIFYFLTRKTDKLSRHHKDLVELKSFYQRQLKRLKGQALEEFTPPPSYKDERGLAEDIGLIEGHSLFQLLDETMTIAGRKKLVENILKEETSSQVIKENQEYIKKLSKNSWPLTRLLISSKHIENVDEQLELLDDFISTPFLPENFKRDYAILSILFTLSIVGYMQNSLFEWWHPAIFPALHFFYFFYISGRIAQAFSRAMDISTHLNLLKPLFANIEKSDFLNFNDQRLQSIKKFSPSKKLRALNFITSGLSVQGHPVIYLCLNGLIPWTFFFAAQLEKQRKKMQDILPDCLKELANFEASMSVAFLYRYQTQTIPEISNKVELSFNDLCHPLIDRKNVISNSFKQTPGTHLNLITGSNMAGKSTFLRTVGINQVLFRMGGPVFAKDYVSYPFRLSSSLKVSDSLADGFSYFYAEVMRLKRIIEETSSDQPVLYFIDEIFRGTNNRERLIGSQAVLRALSQSAGIGFVSTHDLELTKLADENASIRNLHFRDDVSGDELVFSYKILEGPCPTTNALKIMKQAGLPVED